MPTYIQDFSTWDTSSILDFIIEALMTEHLQDHHSGGGALIINRELRAAKSELDRRIPVPTNETR